MNTETRKHAEKKLNKRFRRASLEQIIVRATIILISRCVCFFHSRMWLCASYSEKREKSLYEAFGNNNNA